MVTLGFHLGPDLQARSTKSGYDEDAEREGKKGAAVPDGREPGWVVPSALRRRWGLTIGRSQDVLSGVLKRIDGIDFFVHDGEHSYECMSFEYRSAHAALRPGGALASHDVLKNTAFDDFARHHSLTVHRLIPNLAFVIV